MADDWTGPEIFVINTDGSNQRILTNYAMGQEAENPRDISWTPDSQTVTFVAWYYDRWVIYTAPADGTDFAGYLPFGYGNEANPVWSPDGSRLAFEVDLDGSPDIFGMNANGSQFEKLTDHKASDVHPIWSRDGTRIVFFSDRERHFDLYVMNADGTNVRP